MKAGKYILRNAPFERSEQIDDLILFFRVRKTRITEELYSLIIKNSRPYLHSYVREHIIKLTNKKLVPLPIKQEFQGLKQPTYKKHISNTQPACGLSQDDPIKKVSCVNRMNDKAMNHHPSDSDYEYGLSDW